MIPPLFAILNASTPVKALLGTSPLRVFPWSEAPPDVEIPYATYGVFNGLPENTVNQAPQIDRLGTQIDIWANSGDSAVACYNAIRDALEGSAHMISFDNSGRDQETNLYRVRMDFDFMTQRA